MNISILKNHKLVFFLCRLCFHRGRQKPYHNCWFVLACINFVIILGCNRRKAFEGARAPRLMFALVIGTSMKKGSKEMTSGQQRYRELFLKNGTHFQQLQRFLQRKFSMVINLWSNYQRYNKSRHVRKHYFVYNFWLYTFPKTTNDIY